MKPSRQALLVSLAMLLVMCGCGEPAHDAAAPLPEPAVLVAVSTDEATGDLPAITEAHPDLIDSLPGALSSLVDSQPRGFVDGYLVASFHLVGASTSGDELWLYAHESLATYQADKGKAAMQSASSMPVRIRLDAASLKPVAIDEPLDGDSYAPSIAAMMPAWASERAESLDFDEPAMQAAADRWAATQ